MRFVSLSSDRHDLRLIPTLPVVNFISRSPFYLTLWLHLVWFVEKLNSLSPYFVLRLYVTAY